MVSFIHIGDVCNLKSSALVRRSLFDMEQSVLFRTKTFKYEHDGSESETKIDLLLEVLRKDMVIIQT